MGRAIYWIADHVPESDCARYVFCFAYPFHVMRAQLPIDRLWRLPLFPDERGGEQPLHILRKQALDLEDDPTTGSQGAGLGADLVSSASLSGAIGVAYKSTSALRFESPAKSGAGGRKKRGEKLAMTKTKSAACDSSKQEDIVVDRSFQYMLLPPVLKRFLAVRRSNLITMFGLAICALLCRVAQEHVALSATAGKSSHEDVVRAATMVQGSKSDTKGEAGGLVPSSDHDGVVISTGLGPSVTFRGRRMTRGALLDDGTRALQEGSVDEGNVQESPGYRVHQAMGVQKELREFRFMAFWWRNVVDLIVLLSVFSSVFMWKDYRVSGSYAMWSQVLRTLGALGLTWVPWYSLIFEASEQDRPAWMNAAARGQLDAMLNIPILTISAMVPPALMLAGYIIQDLLPFTVVPYMLFFTAPLLALIMLWPMISVVAHGVANVKILYGGLMYVSYEFFSFICAIRMMRGGVAAFKNLGARMSVGAGDASESLPGSVENGAGGVKPSAGPNGLAPIVEGSHEAAQSSDAAPEDVDFETSSDDGEEEDALPSWLLDASVGVARQRASTASVQKGGASTSLPAIKNKKPDNNRISHFVAASMHDFARDSGAVEDEDAEDAGPGKLLATHGTAEVVAAALFPTKARLMRRRTGKGEMSREVRQTAIQSNLVVQFRYFRRETARSKTVQFTQ